MKIKVLGFQWKMYGNASLTDLRNALDEEAVIRLQQLVQLLTTGATKGWDGIVYAIADESPYWAGVVLKVRDQKQFCRVSGDSGVLRLSAEQLAAGSKMAEINFFLLNPTTGNGIYQYYHHSTWPASFGYLCKRILDAHIVKRCIEIEHQGEKNEWTKKRIRAEKKLIQGTMTPELIVKKESFDKLIDGLLKIELVRVSIRDNSIAIDEMGQLRDAARHMNVQFTFGDDSKIDALRRAVKDAVAKVSPWRMRVEGEDANGSNQIVNLVENPDAFEELDFDAETAGLDLNLLDPASSLHNSSIVQRLLTIAKSERIAAMLGSK